MVDNIISKIKYPKFLLLILSFVYAYLIFSNRDINALNSFLISYNYLGSFAAGILFVYGFTAPIATAVLLIFAKTQNIWITGLIAGLGALLGDFIIFKFIKYSFADEIETLKREKVVTNINNLIPESIRNHNIKKYLLMVFAGIIIASPLPDEIGISLLAIYGEISDIVFAVLSYLLNTIGIFIILVIGSLL